MAAKSHRKGEVDREDTIKGLSPSGEPGSVSTTPYTDDEVQGFAAKLQAWGDTLEPREQQLLIHLVGSGSTAGDDDVQGYGFGFGDWTVLRQIVVQKWNTVGQDVTVNKSKTADKAFNAVSDYIRG